MSMHRFYSHRLGAPLAPSVFVAYCGQRRDSLFLATKKNVGSEETTNVYDDINGRKPKTDWP